MMAPADPGPNLVDQIEDVALLRPHLVARRSDLDAERFLGRRHIYAVDTNVIYFCAQPLVYVREDFRGSAAESGDQTSDRTEQLASFVRYGSIFRSDPIETHAFFCVLLARYVGFHVSKLSPLYVPQSLEPEVAGMADHFAAVDPEKPSSFHQQLTENLEMHLAASMQEQFPGLNIEDEDNFKPMLKRLIRNGIGKTAGKKRLGSLFSKSRIAPLGWINQGVTRRGFQNLGDVAQERKRGLASLSERQTAWLQLLVEAGKPENAQRERDARALAEVELWNEAASQRDKPGKSERMLYLTADTHVHRAALAYTPPWETDDFATSYVRHPTAFLEDFGVGSWKEERVHEAPSSHAASLLEWTDVLMSDYANLREADFVGHERLAPETRRQIRDFHNKHPGESGKVQKSWRNVTDIQERHLLGELGFLGLIEKISNENPELRLAGSDGRIKDFHDAFLAKVMADEADAWESCFEVAAEMLLKRDRTRRVPTRSSPAICFESWQGAGLAVEQFKYWGLNTERFDAQAYRDHRKKLKEIDTTNYAYYLAFAALFAGRSNWDAASALAAFAREVSNQTSEEERRGANGREAAFLEAVCRRFMAVRASDLDRVEFLLDEVDSIFKQELISQVHFTSPEDGGRIVPERFKLERLDVEQTRLLFDWDFKTKGSANSDRRDDLLPLFEAYNELHKALASWLDTWLKRHPTEEGTLGTIGHVMMQTEIRTIISTFSLFSLDIEGLPDQVVDVVRKMLDRLEELQSLSERERGKLRLAPDKSYFANVVTSATRALLGEARRGPIERDAEMKRAKELLSDRFINLNSVYPFDPDRFTRLRDIINRVDAPRSS